MLHSIKMVCIPCNCQDALFSTLCHVCSWQAKSVVLMQRLWRDADVLRFGDWSREAWGEVGQWWCVCSYERAHTWPRVQDQGRGVADFGQWEPLGLLPSNCHNSPLVCPWSGSEFTSRKGGSTFWSMFAQILLDFCSTFARLLDFCSIFDLCLLDFARSCGTDTSAGAVHANTSTSRDLLRRGKIKTHDLQTWMKPKSAQRHTRLAAHKSICLCLLLA